MAVSAWKILISLNAVNMTGPAFTGLVSNVAEATESSRKMQLALGTVRETAALAFGEVSRLALEGFGSAAESAGDLQLKLKLMAQTIGPVSDLGKVMKDLYQAEIALSTGPNRTLFDMSTIADIQQSLIKTGNDPRTFLAQDTHGRSVLQQISYMAELENLATHGEITPATTAKNIGGFLRAYGIGYVKDPNNPVEVQNAVKRAMDVAETFSKVASISPYTSASLKTSETYFGVLARRLGISPEDMIMMGGYMSQMGMNASTASTSLANLFINAVSTTSSSSASTQLPQAILAKMRLGFLGPVDRAIAEKTFLEQNKMLVAHGLQPYLPSTQTPAQLEAAVRRAEYQSMPSVLTEVVKKHGFQGFAQFIDSDRRRYEHLYGREMGDKKFMDDLRSAANIRGQRAFNAVSVDTVAQFVKRVHDQESVQQRIQSLRSGTLAGAEKSVDNTAKTLLVQLGGIGANGKPIAGGPLDMLLRFLHGINQIMIRVSTWGSVHPGAIAKIGTMVGIVGALAALGSVVLAISGALALFSAVTGGIGIAGIGDAVLGTGLAKGGIGLLRAGFGKMLNPFAASKGMDWLLGEDALRVGGKFVRGPLGMLGGAVKFSARQAALRARFATKGWLGDILEGGKSYVGDKVAFAWDWFAGHGQLRDAAGRFMRGGAPRGMFGGAIDSNLSRFTGPFARVFNSLGEVMARALPFIGRLVPVLFEVGLRFAGIIGWVTLAIDALKFFADHPKEIGHWIAEIIIFFRDKLIPGTLDLMGKMAKGIWDYISDLLRRLWEVITHPWEIRDWYYKVQRQVQSDLAADDKARQKAKASSSQHHGSAKVSYQANVHNHFNGPVDHNKVAKATADALDHHLRRAARNGWGSNVPGSPHAAVGTW